MKKTKKTQITSGSFDSKDAEVSYLDVITPYTCNILAVHFFIVTLAVSKRLTNLKLPLTY